MKRILTTIIALTAVMALWAQADSTKVKKKKERTVELSGEVYDSFTKAKVKALMTLMRKDSTFVDSMTCWTWGTSSYYEFKVPAKNDDFIIKATADGYEDTYMNYNLRHIARNSWFELPRILMKKKQRSDDDIYKEVGLNGVVVTGTKVKLAYRGDTLIYNASAFNMPEGSMLDGLIRQMPGAELKDNGDIYINGKKVDYLTLNGKDFFKGQNKVMLDNLPYYTVKELKVFDKSTKQSELIGHDVEKKDYVMDVQLKREYNRGFMGNIEGGLGTDDRYLARLFSLYYDDHSRVSVFGNTNNINENRRPGGEGQWSPSNMPQGLLSSKQTGLHVETEDADKNWEDNLDVTLDWNDADNISRTISERFASGGNIMGGNESWSRNKNFRFNANNYFQVKKPVTIWGYIYGAYSKGESTRSSQDSTYREALINRTVNDAVNSSRNMTLGGSVGMYHKFAWGDYLSFGISGSFGRTKPNDSWDMNRTFYIQADSTEVRHNYADTHGDSYNYEVELGYTLQLLNRWFISAETSYSQDYDNSNNLRYRLDRLKEDKQQTEWLPSTNQLLESVMDMNNVDEQQMLTRKVRASFDISHSTDNDYFSIRLPLTSTHERLNYNDFATLDTVARRNYVEFTPSINWSRWGKKNGLSGLSYNMNMSRPALADLMPVDDTTNPLVHFINNPDLKTTLSHSATIAFQFNNDSTRHFSRIWSNVSLSQRSIGTRTVYNTTTGAYTYMRDNIDGNWTWNLNGNYEQPLDSAKRLTLHQQTDVNYSHSVDFPIQYLATLEQASEDDKSIVNNWTLHEHLSLEYQKGDLTCGISGEVNWRSSTSNREDFQRISAFDYNYGGNLRYTIPWLKLYVGTDIRMHSRRGYQSEMMNTDDLVWNAELSRSLFKEKLTVKLTAFDLLHQLSSTHYSVNAQGRTEAWNNCIPRYVMFSLTYRFTQKPHKM
jgi:hypothetical protein